jgi:hypothetical protein
VKELASTGLARALAESRAEAPELAAELGPYRFEERGHLIRTHRRFVSWGLCEWLCHESVRLTAIDAERAVESAELAVLVSDLLKETEPAKARRLYRLRGYTWAHDGNARRVLVICAEPTSRSRFPTPGGKRARRTPRIRLCRSTSRRCST